MFCDLRGGMIFAYKDIGKTLIIPKQDIIARFEALYKRRFQYQRFRLAFRNHKFHRGCRADHPAEPRRMTLI